MTTQWLTVNEAAEILRQTPKTIRLWCAAKKLDAWQPSGPGGIWLISDAAVKPADNWARLAAEFSTPVDGEVRS